MFSQAVKSRSMELMAERLATVVRHSQGRPLLDLRLHEELRGFSGLDLPERVGGEDWSAGEMARLFRLCGRHDAEARDLIGAGHARFLSTLNGRHFDGLLRDVGRGEAYCAIAITEPEVGSDIRAIRTTAARTQEGYRLNGVKQHISRVMECSHFIVFATVPRDIEQSGTTAFLIPRGHPGLEIEEMVPVGLNRVSWGRLRLTAVDVLASARIGGEGQASSLFSRHFTYWRTMMSALAIGSAQAAIDQAVVYLKTREAFGGPIGRFSHLQQTLAGWTAKLIMAWLLVEKVASDIDSRGLPVVDAAMLKAEAVEIAIGAADWTMSVLGGFGYSVEAGVDKRHRDLLGLRIADGTTDVLRGQVARAFLGERLYEQSLHRFSSVDGFSDKASKRFW